jgi:hypothetical protein
MTDIRFDLPRLRPRTAERLSFRLLVALTYPLFLAGAVLSRLAPFGAVEPTTSVFAQARRASEATIAFAFQG